jgi:hypothetical protein
MFIEKLIEIMATTNPEIIKIATSAKAILANPFVGDQEIIKESFRRWLWLVHQGQGTLQAAQEIATATSNLKFNNKWIGPTRGKLMGALDELLSSLQAGYKLSPGQEAHTPVILSYLQWRSQM